MVYCYLEFKLCYHKNLKLFSIKVKELLEPIVLQKKGNGCLLFLKAFSWETDLWVTLCKFMVKNAKIGKGSLYLTVNQLLSWNETWCAVLQIITNIMSHMCKRIFFKNQTSISTYWQNIKFSWNCPKFHIFTKIVIFQVYLQLFRPIQLHPYKFYGRDMSGILFFIFAIAFSMHFLFSILKLTIRVHLQICVKIWFCLIRTQMGQHFEKKTWLSDIKISTVWRVGNSQATYFKKLTWPCSLYIIVQ